MKNVVIYRDHLLYPSETFVYAQGESLTRFKPFYFGSRRVDGIKLPSVRTSVINDGTLKGNINEVLFKVFNKLSRTSFTALKNINPSLIHAHFGPDGLLAKTIATETRLPLIVTFHGFDATTNDCYYDQYNYSHRKFIRGRSSLIGSTTKFLAVSDFIKMKLIEKGFPEEKIIVHYVGIDLSVFIPAVQEYYKPIVLFVGRLVEKKGCFYLIEAMRYVQENVANAELVVIGDGPLRGELEMHASRFLKNYRFLGVQPSHVVRDWLSRAMVFSVPSITADCGDAEGFGIVFAEAQAMGVPVVSFRSGGIPEAVRHGETGFLVEEKDIKGLTECIKILLQNRDVREHMAGAGKLLVKNKYDLKKQAAKLEDIYSEIIETR